MHARAVAYRMPPPHRCFLECSCLVAITPLTAGQCLLSDTLQHGEAEHLTLNADGRMRSQRGNVDNSAYRKPTVI